MICMTFAAVAWGFLCRYIFDDEERLFPVVAGAIVISIVCGVLGLP